MDLDASPAPPRLRKYGAFKKGPEAALMKSLARWVAGPERMPSRWAATGLPIGAGEPDLVLVNFGPELRDLAGLTAKHVRVLAFLAEIRNRTAHAMLDGSEPLGEDTEETLDDLMKAGALAGAGSSRVLTPEWQEILTETIAIEAKVADWRRGAAQAARNRIFAERSFLALPPRTAERVAFEPLIDEYGIGVLAVAPDGCVTLVREAPRQRPLIWFYYYSLALAVAASLRRSPRGLRRSH